MEGTDFAAFSLSVVAVTRRAKEASSLGSSCGAKKPCH